ncbi:MAG: F0F1 ATP synthase subunit delta [Candidatus Pacebacteria bacterium]|nr:F0F1 ATP synthase subunit delta [Candidatus Paceibacterota bacterium]
MSKISPKNIAEAIYESTQGKSGADLENILKRGARMLQDKRMLGKSEEVLSLLQDMIDKKEGVVRLKVTTAKSMNHEEKKKIEEEIKQKYKAHKVISEYFEKEELLGGMKVEVGYEVLDNTYKSKLQKLEKFLIQGK